MTHSSPHQVSGTVQAPNPRGFLDLELFRLFDHILNPLLAPLGTLQHSLPPPAVPPPPFLPTHAPRLTHSPNHPTNNNETAGGAKSSKNRRASGSTGSRDREKERERDRQRKRERAAAAAAAKMAPPPAPVPPQLAAVPSQASLGGESAVSFLTEASYAAGGGGEGGIKPPARLRKASSRLMSTMEEKGMERLSGALFLFLNNQWALPACLASLTTHVRRLTYPLPPHNTTQPKCACDVVTPGVMLRCCAFTDIPFHPTTQPHPTPTTVPATPTKA